MDPRPRRRPLLTVLAALGTLAAGLELSIGQDEPRPAAPDRRVREGLESAVYPTEACRKCHNEEQPVEPTTAKGVWPICRLTENRTYDQQDKHPLAFQALLDPRGQAMAERLGVTGENAAARIDACVRCHATLPIGVEKVADLDPEQFETIRTDGVTCVACHGMYEEWVTEHPKTGGPAPIRALAKKKAEPAPPRWAELDRRQKEYDYGMTDLWDPVRRAETCASCHVGSVAEGKVLTHAMYAAGHPPLPSFEAASFSNAQPRHWEYLREKLAIPGRAERVKPPIDPDHLEETEMAAVSGLVTLREVMRQFADEAAADRRAEPLQPHWPDFARYDCAACHHDLRIDSWRQRRGYAGAPGRPPAPEWPLALVWLGLEAAQDGAADEQAKRLDDLLHAFHEAVVARPFGDRDESAAAARAVADWADDRIAPLRGRTIDRAQARRLLERLTRMPARAADFDSARQIAWAFRVIYEESFDEGDRDASLVAALDRLTAMLALDLPPAKEQLPIERGLAERLEVAARYDPDAFAATMAEIAGRLPRP
jgi:hypothetical protein